MSLTNEQIVAAHRANVETLFGLTSKAFESVQRLIELNVTASRSALQDSAQHSQALLNIHDAQELLALQASLFQPLAEKTSAYSRQLYDIASGSAGDFAQLFEAQTAELQKNVTSLFEMAAQSAPHGSESSVAIIKNAITSANKAFESIQKAVKQASELADSNLGTPAPATQSASKKR